MIQEKPKNPGAENLSLPEMRVFTLALPENPSPKVLKEQIQRAADAGFNGILIPFFRSGYTTYFSKVARSNKFPAIRPDLKKAPDIFYSIFEALSQTNLSVFAYVDPLCVGDRKTHIFGPILLRRRKWGALSKQRKLSPIGFSEHQLFLCLNNGDVRRFAGDIMVEIAETFPISALVLDISCYPYQYESPEFASCFCEYCRKHVKEEIQLDLQSLSLDPGNSAFRRWKRWKDERFSSFISYISGRVRKIRADMPFAVIVPGELQSDPKTASVNNIRPESWVKEGWVSSLVMRYRMDLPSKFAASVEQDLSIIPDDSLLAPTIWADKSKQLCQYIPPLKSLPLWGYFCSLNSPLSENDIKILSTGPFASASLDPLADIMKSVRTLIEYILGAGDPHLALNSFLRDVLKYLEQNEEINLEKIHGIIGDIRTLEQKFQSGDIDATLLPSQILRHISLIKKLLKVFITLSR